MGIDAQTYIPRSRSRIKTVAERNDVSVSTIWRMVRDGKLTVYRPSPGITLIDGLI
jgi:hypothetical protein